ILNGVEQPNALFHWPLKGFASGDQTHAASALVNNRRQHRVLQVGCAFGFAATVNQPSAAHVAIRHLIAAKVDGMVARQLGIDPFVEFTVTGSASAEGLEPTIILRQLLLYDIRLN